MTQVLARLGLKRESIEVEDKDREIQLSKEVFMGRVKFMLGIIGSILALIFSLAVVAAGQEYPSRPITLISQYAAGGGTYVAEKAISEELQKLFKHPVLVESKPGGGGLVAGDYVAKAKPDGYIMGLFSSPACIPELYSSGRKTTYTSQDLIPVVRYYATTGGLISKKEAPWKNLDEFIKYVKANPKKIKWGHSGVGHQFHLYVVSLAKLNKLEMVPVPFRGASPLITAVLGGHIEAGIVSIASVKGHVESGRIQVLAVKHHERISCLPDIPSVKELGYDMGFPPMYKAFFAPKGTPVEVMKKFQDTVKQVLETPSFKEQANRLCIDLYYGSSADVLSNMKTEREVIGPVLKDIGEFTLEN